jgi:uncharacterized protein YxjI
MYCGTCGTEIPENTQVCGSCGTTQNQSSSAVQLPFFTNSEYVIDEKVSAFKFTNAYKVFDTNGSQIGAVEQQQVSGGQKAARLLFGSNVKGLYGFTLDIKDADGNVLVTIQRPSIKGGSKNMRQVNLTDSVGRPIGFIRFVFSMWTPKMDILDANAQTIARIAGDWKGWNFSITDLNGTEIGTVNKKWNGALKEAFTTADKYHVTILPQSDAANRIAIVAAAITIDMVLKEF